jgi:hypothetical protein
MHSMLHGMSVAAAMDFRQITMMLRCCLKGQWVCCAAEHLLSSGRMLTIAVCFQASNYIAADTQRDVNAPVCIAAGNIDNTATAAAAGARARLAPPGVPSTLSTVLSNATRHAASIPCMHVRAQPLSSS